MTHRDTHVHAMTTHTHTILSVLLKLLSLIVKVLRLLFLKILFITLLLIHTESHYLVGHPCIHSHTHTHRLFFTLQHCNPHSSQLDIHTLLPATRYKSVCLCHSPTCSITHCNTEVERIFSSFLSEKHLTKLSSVQRTSLQMSFSKNFLSHRKLEMGFGSWRTDCCACDILTREYHKEITTLLVSYVVVLVGC